VEYQGACPKVEYLHEGTQKVYNLDIFIHSESRAVEVKSIGTLARNESTFEDTKRKRKAVLSSGYQYGLIVINPDGTRKKIPNNWFHLSYLEFKELIKGF
jgi:hypothetical protein